MTIEIKQLIIRAVADGRREQGQHPAVPLAVVAPAPVRAEPHPTAPGQDREAIIAACVREVLRKLERSRER
ncbi:MAG TPA: DUF5908 family protein [Haliangium sp.]|nr:DUF5908 family protein [Haliangium sp.]